MKEIKFNKKGRAYIKQKKCKYFIDTFIGFSEEVGHTNKKGKIVPLHGSDGYNSIRISDCGSMAKVY